MTSPRLEWAAAGAAAAYTAARLAAADRCPPLERLSVPLVSLTPQASAGAGLLALLLRRRGPAVTAAACGAALAALAVPRAIPRRRPAAGGPLLRLLTANLHQGDAAGPGLVALARRLRADVLLVQELTDDGEARLRDAGLSGLLPHELSDIYGYRYRGSAIYARYPLDPGLPMGPSYASQPSARLTLPSGQQVQLVCVHPHPPYPPWFAAAVPRWRGELAALPAPGTTPVILAGDFNATADHAQFRTLLRLGYRDAASQVGRGLTPTWGPRLGRRPDFLAFDHVLTDPRCAVLRISVHALARSDHRALFAELRLPADGPGRGS
ncbi:MAG TPA: endonuclease/exonuclease/phosphatase family protein [Streptosporangiaceae bacterium]|nr:endonuclease/exonuclease/phosphatase family protein [Streptosporangiaceae bacterium]